MVRTGTIERITRETRIRIHLDLDGDGGGSFATGVGFLDHMLELFAKHALIHLEVEASGDRQVDDHHTVEDVGIALGEALRQALGDKRGIVRYGAMTLPMDETLVTVALDLSGRVAVVWKVTCPTEKVGSFDTQLGEEFWRGCAGGARMNFHALLHHGGNSHHILEAVFKAAGRALRQAVAVDPRAADQIPSTKGTIT